MYVRTGGLTYDAEGNLWMLNNEVDTVVRVRLKDGSWQKAAADMGKSIGYTPDASMNPPKATAKAPSSGASAASEK